MILHTVVEQGKATKPWLVFLHGFSGDHREWQPVGAQLGDFNRLYLDLPGHGDSTTVKVANFADMDVLLRATLFSYNILNYWLVGYSLGGRVAMHYACHSAGKGLAGVIVEGGHPGLTDASEREQRWCHDQHWAQRFTQLPLEQAFDAWYQQPIFAHLTPEQRTALVAVRKNNVGESLAAMLLATSLAVQDDLRPMLRARAFPFYYLCGEYDQKFQAIAEKLVPSCHIIHAAGHNAHRENPSAVVSALAQILSVN